MQDMLILMTLYLLVACRRCRRKHPAMTPRCLGTWSQVMAEEHIKRIKRKWDVHQREKIMRSAVQRLTMDSGAWINEFCWMVEWLMSEYLNVMKQIQHSLFVAGVLVLQGINDFSMCDLFRAVHGSFWKFRPPQKNGIPHMLSHMHHWFFCTSAFSTGLFPSF